MHIILTHTNADFDAVAALLAAHKLNPDAVPVLPERLNYNVRDFVNLYQNGLPFTAWEDFRPTKIQAVMLVDVKRLPASLRINRRIPVQIIDHHPPPAEETATQRVIHEPVGAITTYLVEQIQAAEITLDSLEATLLTLGIYSDTGALTYGTTTPRDVRAAAWLLEHGAVLDTVRRFLSPPLNSEQQDLFEQLINATISRTIEGYELLVCAVRSSVYVEQISSVAHRLRDLLDPAALFVVVEMPTSTMLVCRGTVDAVDLGAIAGIFGGGGHARAAAATIHDMPIEHIVERIWTELPRRVQPTVRVAALMSTGVKTVDVGRRLGDISVELRRIGHEGYPVVEDGRVVGLLTLRDADRALEHGLGDMSVREVMNAGEITLQPDDSVAALEQRMVASGWGQIPIVDTQQRLIGIVTRTDLIKHWARMHPARSSERRNLSSEQLAAVLSETVAQLLAEIARTAQMQDITLYMVGGVVRDLLLSRRNFDIDFVVEGDAIAFAEQLGMLFGGRVTSFRPFGTAKWTLAPHAGAALNIDLTQVPDHLDFATARNEFYEHPTALPTTYSGSIKLDLGRRDFTINTLAIQLSPAFEYGRVLDFFGGERDLNTGIIRVLHSLSFVDDPTRILRAVRFEHRLNFAIDPRTATLIQTALPMLRRITGERLRNELTLLLRETRAADALLNMQVRGILNAIHPAFILGPSVSQHFEQASALTPVWEMPQPDTADLRWHLLAASLPYDAVMPLCERLLIGKTMAESLLAAGRLVHLPEILASEDARPSAISEYLAEMPDLALWTGWLMSAEADVRARIAQYAKVWRHVQPQTSGETLIAIGEKPGPHFGKVLRRLRHALLDGEIAVHEEGLLLGRLLEEERQRDDGSA